ncbi:uncharacterized protein LOC112190979 isoform X4 [Rosa chinensis]|uniref:uncharacterized protein LOC112190979 isoform X4 n=1 Tax=Rosa chinensis TaxID=74649 RepID=UPI001AD9020E|nr:uncharacterized protein LOC112190979 isoform X4 [Rosa chinensis]
MRNEDLQAAAGKVTMMMVSRYFRRTLFATAKSEPSGAASMAKMTAHNPLEEFFEADLDPPMTCRTRFVISSNPEIAGIVPEPDIDTYMKCTRTRQEHTKISADTCQTILKAKTPMTSTFCSLHGIL